MRAGGDWRGEARGAGGRAGTCRPSQCLAYPTPLMSRLCPRVSASLPTSLILSPTCHVCLSPPALHLLSTVSFHLPLADFQVHLNTCPPRQLPPRPLPQRPPRRPWPPWRRRLRQAATGAPRCSSSWCSAAAGGSWLAVPRRVRRFCCVPRRRTHRHSCCCWMLIYRVAIRVGRHRC